LNPFLPGQICIKNITFIIGFLLLGFS